MQITPARPHAPRTPGDDLWMVRATITTRTSADGGDIARFTAVDLDPSDPTPGVHPMLFEHGVLRRTSPTEWTNRADQVRAWHDDEAFAIAQGVYDAARGFLELHLPPTTDAVPISTPDALRLELGDDCWVFALDDAPTEAWAVLQAAMRVRELGAGAPV